MPMQTLTLTRPHRRVLQDLAATAEHARDYRRDTMLERTYSEARYYIMGAFKVDIQDNKEIKRILDLMEQDPFSIEVKYDFENTDLS